jgi:hypothetical protein
VLWRVGGKTLKYTSADKFSLYLASHIRAHEQLRDGPYLTEYQRDMVRNCAVGKKPIKKESDTYSTNTN